MEYKDYYKTLGVSRHASQDEIKKIYRRLARKFHPDVSKEANAEERFKAVNEAYEVLGDPEKRKLYDQLGSNWKAGQEFRHPPGFDPSGMGGFRSNSSHFKTEFGDGAAFSDFFESLFGGGRTHSSRSGFRAKGADQTSTIEIDLQHAALGGPISVRLASGKTLEVKIPPGVSQGQRIRLAGQGAPGLGGGPGGDLYLEIKIRPHRYFRLEGRDIYLDLPITPWEAALGSSVQVPTLSGTVEMKIPAGAQSGNRLRLKGKGLPGTPPGDQYLVLQIHTPPAQTATQREFYERMRKDMAFNPRHQFS